MKIAVWPEVFELYPDLVIGVLILRGIDNTNSNLEVIANLRAAELNLRNVPDIEPINQFPKIHSWREAHKVFGSKPKKYLPSIAALVSRVIKGGKIPSINLLTDLYNAASLKHIMPTGAQDLDCMSGDLILRRAVGNEEFFCIGSAENDPPNSDEVIYADDQGAICRRFNWRDCDRTKLTANSRNVILQMEAIPPVDRIELESAIHDLAGQAKKYCGGDIQVVFLDRARPEFEF